MRRASATFLALAVCASAAAAGEVERSFSKRFDVEPPTRLELEHGDGSVEVTAWDENAIAVDVTYKVEFQRLGVGKDPDLAVDFEQRGEVVRVTGREQGHSGIGFFSTRELEYLYRVRAPRWVALELDGDDGDVAVSGWEAAIEVTLDDGDVRLNDIRGDLRVDLEDGDLSVRGFAGELTVDLDDGDVRIKDCLSSRARIETEDGDVDLDGCAGNFDIATDDGDLDLAALTAGTVALSAADGNVEVEVVAVEGDLDLDVQTEDGDVDLTLGPGIGAAFELSSDDGAVEVGDGAEDLSRQRRRASGRFGDGAGKIRAATGEGRVSLRRSN